jgi:hypothetical protein
MTYEQKEARDEKRAVICFAVFFVVVFIGAIAAMEYSLNEPKRDIEKHGPIVKIVDGVAYERLRSDEDKFMHFSVKFAIHKDGTLKRYQDIHNRFIISEWEYNKFREKNSK